MIYDAGITAFVKNAQNKSVNNSDFKTPSSNLYPDVVIDVILDSTHPQFSAAGGYAGIGSVILQNGVIVRPLNPHTKELPLPQETVLVISMDINYELINQNSTITYQPRLFYISVVDFTSHPQFNATFGVPTNNESVLSNVFNNKNINPLQPYLGDYLIEGRFGNSIRFSSTNKSSKKTPNIWSNDSPIGDPILILRNGLSPLANPTKFIPVNEDINNDLSSIYQTSTQLIPIKVANTNYFSYFTPPTSPNLFNKPQVIINSDRVVINAKSDHVLISAQKSVNLSSNTSINFDSKDIIFDTKSFKIGSKNATESILLGNKTIVFLEQLLITLGNVMSVLENEQVYPNGAAAPNAPLNTVAINSSEVIKQLKSSLNSLKSKVSKTI